MTRGHQSALASGTPGRGGPAGGGSARGGPAGGGPAGGGISLKSSVSIGQVLDDCGLRVRLTEAGRERVARFTWQRCAAETLEVLERIAKRA